MIGIASDHAAFPLKQFVIEYLKEKGLEFNLSATVCKAVHGGQHHTEAVEQRHADA